MGIESLDNFNIDAQLDRLLKDVPAVLKTFVKPVIERVLAQLKLQQMIVFLAGLITAQDGGGSTLNLPPGCTDLFGIRFCSAPIANIINLAQKYIQYITPVAGFLDIDACPKGGSSLSRQDTGGCWQRWQGCRQSRSTGPGWECRRIADSSIHARCCSGHAASRCSHR